MVNKLFSILASFLVAIVGIVVVSASPVSATNTTWMDTSDRDDVETWFRDLKVLTSDLNIEAGWTGSISGCNAGTTNAAVKQSQLDVVNHLRQMAGVTDLTLDTGFSQEAQAAALIMAANQSLSHNPSPAWNCYTAAGSEGASKSNLAYGTYGVNSISNYLSDHGEPFVGHRLWLLNARIRKVGFGDIPGPQGVATTANATRFDMFSLASSDTRESDSTVKWPSSGYFPVDYLPADWSVVSWGGMNFSNANVTVTQDGSPVAVSNLQKSSSNLIFEPNVALKGVDSNIVVTVTGVLGHSSSTYSYTVTSIPEAEEPLPPIPKPLPKQTFAEDQVSRLFSAFFNRDAGSGVDYWVGQLQSGDMDIEGVAEFFAGSEEFLNKYGSVSDTEFIELIYSNLFSRPSDAAGLVYWSAQLQAGVSRGEMMVRFSDGSEYVNVTGTSSPLTHSESEIWRLYGAVFSRFPDSEGLEYWTGQYNAVGLNNIAQWFSASPEFISTYGSVDNDRFVYLVYQNVLNRAPDESGLTYWRNRMATGMTRGQLIVGFSNSPEYIAKTGTIN